MTLTECADDQAEQCNTAEDFCYGNNIESREEVLRPKVVKNPENHNGAIRESEAVLLGI